MFLIQIESKNKGSLLTVIKLTSSLLNNLQIIHRLENKVKKIVRFNILRSSNIHKGSQIALGFKVFKKKIILMSYNVLIFFILLKTFLDNLFCDIKITVINYTVFLNYRVRLFSLNKLYLTNRISLLVKFLNITARILLS